MRLHFNLCLAVVQTLEKIFHDGEYADKAIERILKTDKRWGSRDRGFIAETTYDIVRYFRRYVEIAGDPRDSLTDWWELVGCYLYLKKYEMPHWEVFNGNKYIKWDRRAEEFRNDRKVWESIPDWMDELGYKELGHNWSYTLSNLNKKAKVVLRANTIKGSQEATLKGLFKEGIEGKPMGENAIVLKERKSVFRTDMFRNGFFEVQDYSSQQVSEFLDVKPGMRVFDACAGAGGKTLHLAALMQNKGSIIALDNVEWKLKELKKRAKRAGAHIIERRHIDSTKVIKRLKNQADRLLLDAPCSGLGVLRRNPDAKWKLTPEFLENIKKTQREIISSYSRMVKPGGKMVYATCSVLPSENREQVDWFLKQNDEWTFVKDKSILPQDEGFDGFYMALLVRKGGSEKLVEEQSEVKEKPTSKTKPTRKSKSKTVKPKVEKADVKKTVKSKVSRVKKVVFDEPMEVPMSKKEKIIQIKKAKKVKEFIPKKKVSKPKAVRSKTAKPKVKRTKKGKPE